MSHTQPHLSSQELTISQKAEKLLAEVPSYVTIVAAAKKRTVAEVQAAIQGGIRHIGHNYVQEGRQMLASLPSHERELITYHLIGHLQRNKAAQAVQLFDVIQTLDSLELAQELEHRCQTLQKTLPVLIEVNSGREPNKSGIFPEHTLQLAEAIQALPHLRLEGLMTMGPWLEEPEKLRPFFRATRQLYGELQKIPAFQSTLRYLSMGMSDSYLIAIEEGANMVRIGTLLFGARY